MHSWYSPQTFALGQGPGSGRECWRHVTFWAAASLKSLSAGAGAAESPLFASHHLSAGGKQTERRHKLLISGYSILYLPVLKYGQGGGFWNRRVGVGMRGDAGGCRGMQGLGGGGRPWLTNLLSVCHFSIRRESRSDKQPMTYSVKPEVVHYKSTY